MGSLHYFGARRYRVDSRQRYGELTVRHCGRRVDAQSLQPAVVEDADVLVEQRVTQDSAFGDSPESLGADVIAASTRPGCFANSAPGG